MTRRVFLRRVAFGASIGILASFPLAAVALSGGCSRAEGNERLRRNQGVIASFSRALLEDLTSQQSDAEFDSVLDAAIESIYLASTTKSQGS